MSEATDTLSFFRTRWATRFTATCVINRVGLGALNTTTLEYTPTNTPQYSGPCLVRWVSGSSLQIGEELIEVRNYLLVVPHDEEDVAVDDVATITSTNDGVLDGKALVIRSVHADEYNTSRKFDCDDYSQGASG